MAKKRSWFSLVKRLFISDPGKVVVFTRFVLFLGFFFLFQIEDVRLHGLDTDVMINNNRRKREGQAFLEG